MTRTPRTPGAAFTPDRTWRTVARGVAAVAVAVLAAVDALITAAVGIPPLAWCARRAAAAVREEYRLGRYGRPSTCTAVEVAVVDAEIVHDEDEGGTW